MHYFRPSVMPWKGSLAVSAFALFKTLNAIWHKCVCDLHISVTIVLVGNILFYFFFNA